MKLFTAEIDKKLFAQYLKGSDLANQVVVAKIFNPYGRGTWYLLNSDPEDPEYLWAIVDLGDIEVGSVNRSDLENIRIKPFMLGLERDLSFTPMNAAEIYRGLNSGKTYAKGGGVGKLKVGDKVIHAFGGKWFKGNRPNFKNGEIIKIETNSLGNVLYEIKLTDGSIVFGNKKEVETNPDEMANGGGVGDYKLKDNVDFYYGRADEKKVISGTITDILNDGYTISTGFTQVMVKPNEIVGYSKQAEPKKKRFGIFANGGGVDLNDWDMPVIRTQFEDEEYEFEKGGEVTADERMKSLKNYPKLKF